MAENIRMNIQLINFNILLGLSLTSICPTNDIKFVMIYNIILLDIFLNIWRQILLLGELHDADFYNFCTIECGTFNCPRSVQLPARLSICQCAFT